MKRPNKDPHDRISHLQKKLSEQNLSGALIVYSRDVFYYTGTAQPSYLVVLPDDYRLFIRSGYDFACNEVFIDKGKIEEERRLDNIYKKIFRDLSQGACRIGMELDVVTVWQLGQVKKNFRT